MLIVSFCVFAFLGFSELRKIIQQEQSSVALRSSVVTIPVDGSVENDPLYRKIDWDILQKASPDVIGWIFVPGTKIDYPILKGEKYLNKNYEGRYDPIGSVFTFSKAELTDSHLCLYAHNWFSGQAFGSLREFRELNYAKERKKCYVYTPLKSVEYDCFSVISCLKTDEIWEIRHAYEGQTLLMESLQNRSEVKLSFTGNKEGQIITLGTCDAQHSGTPQRLAVSFISKREKAR